MSAIFHALEITDIRNETDDAISVRFDVPDALRPTFQFQPGQHLTLRVDINGEDVRRNYSICAAPEEDELRIAIRQIPGGVFSAWASTMFAPGTAVDVMPPHGSFTWNFGGDAFAHYFGFAGGSGITPILSLLKSSLAQQPQCRFTLFYGNRSSASIMFLEELAALKDRYLARLQVYHFLEDEEQDIDLFNGRLDSDKIAQLIGTLIPANGIDAAFVCGPAPMMTAVETGLARAGVPAAHILTERFIVDRPNEAQLAAQHALERRAEGLRVHLTLDGRRRTLIFDSRKGSILENARAAGMPAPYACKAGVCATCRARLISGRVQMKANYGLSAEDIAQGYILACQAVPLDDGATLDFDG